MSNVIFAFYLDIALNYLTDEILGPKLARVVPIRRQNGDKIRRNIRLMAKSVLAQKKRNFIADRKKKTASKSDNNSQRTLAFYEGDWKRDGLCGRTRDNQNIKFSQCCFIDVWP